MTELSTSPLVITPGEPAGIGPDILLAFLKDNTPTQPLVAVTDANLLHARAAKLGIKLNLPEYTPGCTHPFSIIHHDLIAPCIAGTPDPTNSPFVLKTLDTAIQGCLEHKFRALVTGPINKAVIQQAGIPFSGHTGYLAKKTHTPHVVMMFTLGSKRLALVTTHIPLTQVAAHITEEALISTTTLVNDALRNLFKIPNPRILMTGLNPHAGEQGTLGTEEIKIIEPAIAKLQQQHIDILGPVSADTAILTAEKYQADLIISLFHDQLLPAFKTLGFGNLVNLTLGLPFVRTSVDHGTAFELAGSGKADPDSLKAACNLADRLSTG